MILARLKEHWDRQTDGLPSGYQRAFLTKRIVIDADAKLVNVESLSGEKRGKREGLLYPVPREQPQRTVAIRPRLVQDNPNYTLGKSGPEDKPEKVAQRHAAYLELLKSCFDATHEPSVGVLLRWLSSDEVADSRLDSIDADTDELLFEVDGVIPTDVDSLKAFWAMSEGATVGRCLVTGEETNVVDRMPFAIKGIPEGQTAGTMLVSVNNPSGESYGLTAALNSPIGSGTAEAICNGLNGLLADAKHSLRVGPVVYVYWTREPVEFDFMAMLDKPEEGEVRLLIEAAARGGPLPDVSAPDFFVLALSANASRIVVRDFHETTLPKVQRELGEWYRRLELIGTDGKPARPLGAFRLAASLYRDSKDIPKHVPVEILRSAISGTPLPKDLLALAVKRNVAMQGPFDVFRDQRLLSMGRLALIKACLTEHPEDATLTSLNLEHPDPAYHCGRLLSVLESIQRLAVQGLNTTLVEKHYGSACGAPSISFGALLRDATSAHLPKLRKNRPGAYIALDQRLQEVLSRIGQSFPKTLDYEHQGLFALGYYHQRASDFAAAKANKELKGLDDSTTTETETEQ